MKEPQELIFSLNDLSLKDNSSLESEGTVEIGSTTDLNKTKKHIISSLEPMEELGDRLLNPEIHPVSDKEDSLTIETVADQISKNLNESNRDLIYRIVKAIGIEQALKFYDKTRHVEQSGGIYYKDGSKRKKPGGVFFYLISNDKSIADGNIKKIFAEESHKKYKQRKDQIKEERKKRTEELRLRIIEEGLLSLENQKKEV